jgi:hypothetical protein
MGDTFIDSFSKGLNFAHTMENDRRLQAAQQQQAQMQQMQMMKLAAELSGIARQQQQQEFLSQSLQPVQEPSRFQQAPQQDNFGLSQNPPQELVSGGLKQSPFAQFLNQRFGMGSDVLANPQMGGVPLKDMYRFAPKEGKEVNVANEIDTVLGGMFKGYYQDPAVRKKALDYYATPEGSKIVQEAATKYQQGKAPPIYNIMPGYQTSEGKPIPFDVRKGGVPQNIQKTPSESDVAAARGKTSIDAVIDEIDSAFTRAEKSLPQTPTERISGYPVRMGKLQTQTDTNLVLADSLSKGFLAKFARAAGEVGVLTDRDIVRAEKLAVTIHDTPAVRKGKLQGIKNLFNEIYERGKRQQNPLGNAPNSNEPAFDIPVGRKGSKPTLDQIFKGR